MKINRLLEITTILLNKKMVTAGELAERFNVSTRTIYRDIDVLSSSGVPVYAVQGTGGGISVLEDYTLGRTVLSDTEKDSIIFALKTLQTTKSPDVESALEKLGAIFKSKVTDWITVDFSSWGSDPNTDNKFNDIKTALISSRVIEIEYINSFNQNSSRRVEPLRLLFKSQAWYLWAYCYARQEYRLFRISRIRNVVITDESFDRSVAHTEENHSKNTAVAGSLPEKHRPLCRLVLEFSEEAMYRLCDDYDRDMIVDNKNGTYTVEVTYPEDEWVYGYIMSFGDYVKVIEPERIREIVKEKYRRALAKYDLEI